jgi:GT2 family glycosyltransferase
LVSVIVLNYNGAAWLERCLASLQGQTIAAQLEIIVADNASPDRSDRLAARLLSNCKNSKVLPLGGNFGYSAGNNLAAEHARGDYLLFLNNDTWLEPDCLERLVEEVREAGAPVGTPLVMEYDNDRMQSVGAGGFDLFGLPCRPGNWSRRREIFMASGCALLIEREWFRKLGGFDPEFFMYADEYDLCWRVWVAGGSVVLAPSARLHHRSAAGINPRGGERMVENRTSDTNRFYANRNSLLALLKNCQHLLLATVLLQILLLGAEGFMMGLLTRRWSHVRRSYLGPLLDCWRLRGHILAERRRLAGLRKRGDFWMLRFPRARLNRWDELKRCRRFGLPKVEEK